MKRVIAWGIGLAITLALVGAGCQNEKVATSGNDVTTDSDATSPSQGATNAGTPQVAKRLGPAPTTCTGPKPRLVAFGDYGNLAGSAPVWAGFYATFDEAGQRYRIERDAPRGRYGWRLKVLWVVGPELDAPARVEAYELASRAALLFQIEAQERTPAPIGTLDPQNPGVRPTNDGYKEFPSYLYVPRAGCYALDVSWTGDRWRLVFGLGR